MVGRENGIFDGLVKRLYENPLSEAVKNHPTASYIILNTVGAAAFDIAMVGSITDWHTFICSGKYDAYQIFFNSLRFSPTIYYLGKSVVKKSKESFYNALKYAAVGLISLPFEDVAFYLMKLKNPLDPFSGEGWIKALYWPIRDKIEYIPHYFLKFFTAGGLAALGRYALKKISINSLR